MAEKNKIELLMDAGWKATGKETALLKQYLLCFMVGRIGVSI
jgi:hypothetical protein